MRKGKPINKEQVAYIVALAKLMKPLKHVNTTLKKIRFLRELGIEEKP